MSINCRFHLITSCTNMRQQDVNEFFVPRVNHEFWKRNIRYIAAVTYNSTSVSVIANIYSHSLVCFSSYIKDETIEHYNNRCTIEHCHSCRQRYIHIYISISSKTYYIRRSTRSQRSIWHDQPCNPSHGTTPNRRARWRTSLDRVLPHRPNTVRHCQWPSF